MARVKRSFGYALAACFGLLSVAPAMAQSPIDDPSMTTPNVIAMKDNSFVPAEMVVPLGTSVAWRNDDAEDHDIVSLALQLESPLIGPGKTFSYTFAQPGTYAYVCDLHDGMEAKITVTADAGEST